MLTLNKKGTVNPLVIPLVLAILLLIGAGIMAGKFYMDFTAQRDNNQPIIAAAVEEAKTTQKKELDKEFAEKEKIPNDVYTAPSEFGRFKLTYPKTWSGYVDIVGGTQLNFYSHPNVVPAKDVNYALRASVVPREFAVEVKQYDALVRDGKLKASAIEVSGVKGIRLQGFLEPEKEGTMVVFPLRDKTLRVWTESKDFRGDFNNIVIKKLSFVP